MALKIWGTTIKKEVIPFVKYTCVGQPDEEGVANCVILQYKGQDNYREAANCFFNRYPSESRCYVYKEPALVYDAERIIKLIDVLPNVES